MQIRLTNRRIITFYCISHYFSNCRNIYGLAFSNDKFVLLKVFKVSNFKEQRVLSQTVISWMPGHKGTVVRKVHLLTLQWSHMTTVTLKPFDPWNHTMNKLIFDQNLFNQTDWQLNQIWNQLSSLSITVHGLQWVFLPLCIIQE